ncbi:MAG TPA: hypothetical protein VL137_03985 [Polyangiaceae bacterium]|nr:hypothetical protein [Polyangiaceae bacterium]
MSFVACDGSNLQHHATLDAGQVPDAHAEPAAPCFVPQVSDPDFATMTAWSVNDGVTVTPGALTFSVAGICAHKPVTQKVLMPPLSCARPLTMTVDTTPNDLDRVNFVLGFGGHWYPQLFAGNPRWTFCLGASASDGMQTLAFGGAVNPGFCPVVSGAMNSITFHHLSIEEDLDHACPLPGTIRNGDFESGAAPWMLNTGNGIAELAPGQGEGDSVGARVATDRPCTKPSIRGVISLPSSAMVPNPALRIWSNGPVNSVASVRIGPRPPDYLLGATYLPGQGSPAVSNICIPRWAQGTAQQFELALAPTEYTEKCAAPRVQEFLFDGLSFVTDPACAADANVFDPGFEHAADRSNNTAFWALQRYSDNSASDVELVVDPTLAYSGKVAARFTGSSPCPIVNLSGGVTMPTPVGASGPALKFWYDASKASHLGLKATLGSLASAIPLPATTGWKQVTACLDSRMATRPELLTFSLESKDGGGTCADTFPTETVLLDDIELTVDPNCPAG